MNPWQNYLIPESVADALGALASAPGSALPIAGGTDLLIDLQQGRHSPVNTLVDVSRVREMRVIETRGDHLFIGSAVPLGWIAEEPLVLLHAQALVEACALIAGPQVRNVATLGGNVAHALPAGDGTIALLALDSIAEVAGLGGRTLRPLAQLFSGPGKSTLQAGKELLVGFRVPLGSRGQASCFARIMRPQGVALPILNVAVWLQRRDDVIADARVAVGPGAPVPWRAKEAEHVLAGGAYSERMASRALDALLAGVEFRSSARRGSAEYRRHLVRGLFLETLRSAWNRSVQE